MIIAGKMFRVPKHSQIPRVPQRRSFMYAIYIYDKNTDACPSPLKGIKTRVIYKADGRASSVKV